MDYHQIIDAVEQIVRQCIYHNENAPGFLIFVEHKAQSHGMYLTIFTADADGP